MVKVTLIAKQSKSKQREYYASKRGSWNGISPMTRIVPSRRVYDRKHMKRETRGASGE